MSREIEFRAWLKQQKQMAKVNAIFFGLGLVEIEKKDKVYTGQHFEDIELMQYTGIKDKNGVKIFEGDIVLNWEEESAVVIWNNGLCRYELDYGNYQVTFEHCCVISYKVIGNIYENPELLGENNE